MPIFYPFFVGFHGFTIHNTMYYEKLFLLKIRKSVFIRLPFVNVYLKLRTKQTVTLKEKKTFCDLATSKVHEFESRKLCRNINIFANPLSFSFLCGV